MTEEKRNRIAAAVTVTTILLIVILAAIVIYQLVVLSIVNSRRREIEREIAYYEEQTQTEQEHLDYLQSEWFLQDKLLEYGYHRP